MKRKIEYYVNRQNEGYRKRFGVIIHFRGINGCRVGHRADPTSIMLKAGTVARPTVDEVEGNLT